MDMRQDQYSVIVETDFFISWDDPDEESVSVGFLERNMLMEFDYTEFLEFADVVDQIRTHIDKALAERRPRANGAGLDDN